MDIKNIKNLKINLKKLKKIVVTGGVILLIMLPKSGKVASTYTIKKGDTLSNILTTNYSEYLTVISWRDLARYNRIENGDLIHAGTTITLPTVGVLMEKGKYISHVIQKGDKLSDICRYYYDTTDCIYELAKFNGIQNTNQIYTGRTLVIPSYSELTSIKNEDNEIIQDEYYTIKKNDTLYKICREKYQGDNIFISKAIYVIGTINGLEDMNIINTGKTLLLPDINTINTYYDILVTTDFKYDSPQNYYVVQKGDTLSKILKYRYGNLEYLDFIVDLNCIENKNVIHTGDVLYLPGMYKTLTK